MPVFHPIDVDYVFGIANQPILTLFKIRELRWPFFRDNFQHPALSYHFDRRSCLKCFIEDTVDILTQFRSGDPHGKSMIARTTGVSYVRLSRRQQVGKAPFIEFAAVLKPAILEIPRTSRRCFRAATVSRFAACRHDRRGTFTIEELPRAEQVKA